jgi:OOP family OmpA-OmpF porin
MNPGTCISRVAAIPLLTVTIIANLTMIAPAALGEPGSFTEKLYIVGDLGGSWIEDTSIKGGLLIDSFSRGAIIKFDSGVHIGLGLGYHLTESVAVQIETGLTVNFTTSIGGDTATGGGLGFFQVPILAKLVYTIPTHSPLRPFLGVGIGGVDTTLDDSSFFQERSSTDFGLAWQAFAGVRYQISSHFELGVIYKYLGTTDRSFDSFRTTIGGTQTHSLSASLLVTF